MHETILRALNDIFVIPIPIYKYFYLVEKRKIAKVINNFSV